MGMHRDLPGLRWPRTTFPSYLGGGTSVSPVLLCCHAWKRAANTLPPARRQHVQEDDHLNHDHLHIRCYAMVVMPSYRAGKTQEALEA